MSKSKNRYLFLEKDGYTFKIRPIGRNGACSLTVVLDKSGVIRKREVYKSFGEAQKGAFVFLQEERMLNKAFGGTDED